MSFVLDEYGGSTYSMSLFHWQPYLMWICYAVYRLLSQNNSNDYFIGSISYQNESKKYLFSWTITLLIVNTFQNRSGKSFNCDTK